MNQKSNRLMYDMNNRKRNNSNKNPGLVLVAIGLYLLVNFLSIADGGEAVVVVLLILLVAGLALAGWYFGKKYVKNQGTQPTPKAAPRKKEEDDGYCKTCSDEFVYNNRQTEYNEHAQEDNFRREQRRRLQQLDGFLKNGLIDQKEYQLLRARYEKELS